METQFSPPTARKRTSQDLRARPRLEPDAFSNIQYVVSASRRLPIKTKYKNVHRVFCGEEPQLSQSEPTRVLKAKPEE